MCHFLPRLGNSLLALRTPQFWAVEFEKFAEQVTFPTCYRKKSASTALLNGQILTDFPGQVLDDSALCVTAPCWIDGGHNAIPNTTYCNLSNRWAQARCFAESPEHVVALMMGRTSAFVDDKIRMPVLSILVLDEAWERGDLFWFYQNCGPLSKVLKGILKEIGIYFCCVKCLLAKPENLISMNSSYIKIWAWRCVLKT